MTPGEPLLIVGIIAFFLIVSWAAGRLAEFVLSVHAHKRRPLESSCEFAARSQGAAWPTVAEHLVVERARAERVAVVVSLDAYRAGRGWDAA